MYMMNLILSILIHQNIMEIREVMKDEDLEILLGRTLYNSVKVRLIANLAGRDEWNYYGLNRLDIINFKLTMKFKIYSRYIQLSFPNRDHRYHKFFWPIKISGILE